MLHTSKHTHYRIEINASLRKETTHALPWRHTYTSLYKNIPTHVTAASWLQVCPSVCRFWSPKTQLFSSKFDSTPTHMRLLRWTGTTDWLTGMMAARFNLFKCDVPVQEEKNVLPPTHTFNQEHKINSTAKSIVYLTLSTKVAKSQLPADHISLTSIPASTTTDYPPCVVHTHFHLAAAVCHPVCQSNVSVSTVGTLEVWWKHFDTVGSTVGNYVQYTFNGKLNGSLMKTFWYCRFNCW